MSASVKGIPNEPPLTGLRVVEVCGDSMTAAAAGATLSQLGADVIKVERPRVGDSCRYRAPFVDDEPGPDRSGWFSYLNAGKRSVTLDIFTPTGRHMLERLAADADAVIEDISAPDRDGFSEPLARNLFKSNNRLVAITITPFGTTGPQACWRGYGININAVAGFALATGEPDREPLAFPGPTAELLTGTHAAAAVIAAVEERGAGVWIDLAAVEALELANTSTDVIRHQFAVPTVQRSGHRSQGSDGFSSVDLPCRDGFVHLSPVLPGQLERLLVVAGLSDLVGASALDVEAELATWLSNITEAELLALEFEHNLGVLPVYSPAEVLNSDVWANAFVDTQVDESVLRLPRAAARADGWALEMTVRAPRLGEHNISVWCDQVGVSRAELITLYETGIL